MAQYYVTPTHSVIAIIYIKREAHACTPGKGGEPPLLCIYTPTTIAQTPKCPVTHHTYPEKFFEPAPNFLASGLDLSGNSWEDVRYRSRRGDEDEESGSVLQDEQFDGRGRG